MTEQTTQNQHRFVIGIGSQRAGSTLLHNLLDESTSIFMHPLKELHYFDSLFHVRAPQALVAFSRRQLDRQLDEIIAATQYGFIDKSYKCLLRTNRIGVHPRRERGLPQPLPPMPDGEPRDRREHARVHALLRRTAEEDEGDRRRGRVVHSRVPEPR